MGPSSSVQPLYMVTEKEIQKFVFCEISFYMYRVACIFCLFSPTVCQNYIQNTWLKIPFLFPPLQYHALQQVGTMLYKTGEKVHTGNIFMITPLTSSSTGHYDLNFLPVDLLGLNECLSV